MIQENNKTKSLEEIFGQTLNLWEKGKSLPEILAIFPEYQKELKELFDVIEFMKKGKSEIMPGREILNNLLSKIDIPSVTKTEENRFIYRKRPRGLKGRLLTLQVEIEKMLNFMQKKTYLFAGAAVIIVAAIGIYWYSQRPKVAIFPEIEELSQETESLSQDISDIEAIAKDKNLDTLEEDLLALAEETPLEQDLPSVSTVDVSEVESLENELSAELEGILNDLTDLEGFEEDTPLNKDNFDTSLSGLTE